MSGPMKKQFTTFMVLVCLDFSFAQGGLQGNATLGGKATIATTGHSVTLTWNASQNAASYNVYRGTIHGGPYLKVASGIVSTTYTDVQVTDNQTLYYVTTAVNGTSESGYSNEAPAVIP
jgi:fibronectin type 3 domain-containing protein